MKAAPALVKFPLLACVERLEDLLLDFVSTMDVKGLFRHFDEHISNSHLTLAE